MTLSTVAQPSGDIKSVDDATALAQAVYDRPNGNDSSAKVEMLMELNGRPAKSRVLYMYGMDKGEGERLTLLRFVEPADVDGTGLLTNDHANDDSDQWLYLPALDRVRKISSRRKGGRFVGSDFFYEDLTDREVAKDRHRMIGEDKVGGIACKLLESTPLKKSNSVYSKRVSCIHERLKIPLRIDFYGRKKEPIKRLQARKIKKIQGYWTIFESTMYDLEKGNSTLLKTTEIVYDRNLPDRLFSLRGLSDTSLEKTYRPDQIAFQPKKETD